MSLLPYALTTVARVKDYASISVSTYDTVLERLVNSATEFIEGYCDRHFQQTAYTNELFTGSGNNEILLPNYPIDSSATFTLQKRDSSLNEDNWSTIETDVYYVDYATGFVTLVGGCFNTITFNYRVSYTAGYDFDNSATFLSDNGINPANDNDSAADLEETVWEMVYQAFQSRRQRNDVQSERIGDYAATYRKVLRVDDTLRETLDRYRRLYM